MLKRIRRVLVEAGARDYEMTRRVLGRLSGAPVEFIQDRQSLSRGSAAGASALAAAKTTLLLAVQKGPFWRSCPGTKDYLCCGYQVLQVALNCPYDCTYCILQGYVNVPAITVFVNMEDLAAELRRRWEETPDRVWRLGTGEFGDSLALEELTGLHEALLPLFARRPRALLEIKSKGTGLENLLGLGPNPQAVLAWSLNPPEIVRQEERFTASLGARLRAARLAASAGFRLAFHFDPIIYFPGWEAAYHRTVELLGRAVSPRDIVWISLGALRFLPPLRRLILGRFPASRLAAAEMVRAPDGKLRYFWGLRLEMYARLREWLTQAVPGALVYLCMESPRVWRGVFGSCPDGEGLAHMLDGQVSPGTKSDNPPALAGEAPGPA